MSYFFLNAFPLFATILMVYCYIPQIYLIYKNKDANSQSLQFWIMISTFLLSMFSMNLYSYTHGSKEMLFGVISQLANFILAIIILIETIYYKYLKK